MAQARANQAAMRLLQHATAADFEDRQANDLQLLASATLIALTLRQAFTLRSTGSRCVNII